MKTILENQSKLMQFESALRELLRDYHVKADAGFFAAVSKSVAIICLKNAS